MSDMTIDDELALIKKNRAPSQALQDGLQGLSDTFQAATTADTPEAALAAAPAAAAAPTPAPRSPADIDAELGLPPAETGLAPLPEQDAGFFDVMGAAWRGETIRTDAWNHAAVRRMELVSEMYQMLSERDRQTVGREFVKGQGWQNASRDVVAAAARAAAESPDAAARWARYPQTTESLEQKILADRIADLDEAEAVLAQPGGGFAEFVGAGARAMTDETSVVLLPFGLSGSLWRKIAGEAALGAVGEAAVLPKEYRVAEEMGLADPNAAARIGMGAAFGGILATGAHLLGRGYSAYMSRTDARRASLSETLPEGVDRIDHEAAVDAAEAQLRGDLTVQEGLGYEGSARAEAALDGNLGAILGKERARVVLDNTGAGTIRSQPIDTVLEARLSDAVTAVYGPSYTVRVYSGGQPENGQGPRTGSTRHDHGKAADVRIYGPDGKQLTGDDLAPIAQFWAASKFGGVGLEMRGGGIHLDIHETAPGGGGMAWNYADQGGQLTAAQQAALDAGLRGEMPQLRGTPGAAAPSGAAPILPPVGPDAPPDWERIRNGILAGESGGDYNALFGYQNRKGGKFSNVKLTEMTVDQAIAFSDPSGPYGQWVRTQVGRVATPMGAYQIVGSTLRDMKRQLGLKGDEKMTAEFQEFLGQQIYLRQGTDAWEGYAGPRDTFSPAPADRDAPAMGDTSRGYTGQGQVAVGDNTRIDVDYEVVDYRSLIRASGDLQPRDRTRINSDEWVASTAARLDPAQLMPAPTADRGTPIVGPDNVIESGNGRSMAIARAYERHPDRAEAYRGAIEAAGYTIPDGVEQPVLIARRRTDLSPDARRQLVIDAQDSGVAQMTPTEVARATARNLASPILARLDPNQPLGADANGDFVRAALATLPRSARNAMFDPGGALNALGQRQLKEAIFARAWPDPDILARYTEGAPAELKSLMEALETAAPSWAALKADIEAGLVTPEMDISGFVLDAMRLIGAAREVSKKGTPIATVISEMLDEVHLIDGPWAPLTAALVRKMWRNGRAAPADEVASFLTRYADEARKAGQAGGMFKTPGPRDVLRTIDPDGFKDLPEDMGQARGFAARPTSEAPPETVAQIPGGDFDQGARSVAAEATHAEIEAGLRGSAASDGLEDMLSEGASLDQIAAHPRVVAAVAEMDQRVPTTELPGYGTNDFWANRAYRAGDIEIIGRPAAVSHLYDQARGLAWTDEGLSVPANSVKAERKATILLGPPAAGKSTIANPLARARNAMIIDADEAKKLIPEYDRGIGAAAVHEESSVLADSVFARALGAGDNMVLPKVGAGPASIERLSAILSKNGFTVDLVLVDVPEAVAMQRMIRRFSATGRIIPLDVLKRGVDGAKATYQLLKSKEQIHAYSHIDNSPDLGQARRAVEDRAEVLAEIARGDRGDGNPGPGGSGPRSGPEDLTTPQPAARSSEAALPQGEAAAAISAARDELAEFADIEIDLPDGTTARAGDILDDLDADRAADEAINTCALNPAGAFLQGATA